MSTINDMPTTARTPQSRPRKQSATKPRARKKRQETPKAVKPPDLHTKATQNPDLPLLALAAPTMTLDLNSWGEILGFILDFAGISPDVLADRLGSGRSTVYSWISGERGKNIPEQKLREIADELGIDVRQFYADRDELVAWIRNRYPAYDYRFDDVMPDGNDVKVSNSTWAKESSHPKAANQTEEPCP